MQGSNFLGQLIVPCPFNIQGHSSDIFAAPSDSNDCNEANIVEKDPAIHFMG